MENSFRSHEELYFSWYLEELKRQEFIESFSFEPTEFNIADLISYGTYQARKTLPPKFIEKTLLNNFTYTPDFCIIWKPKAIPMFLKILDNNFQIFDNKLPFFAQIRNFSGTRQLVSWIDVKGSASQRIIRQEGLIKFPYKQHLMYTRHGIYVNKTLVPNIFKSTFTPHRFLSTDVKMEPRIIHFATKSLSQYLASRIWHENTEEITALDLHTER